MEVGEIIFRTSLSKICDRFCKKKVVQSEQRKSQRSSSDKAYIFPS